MPQRGRQEDLGQENGKTCPHFSVRKCTGYAVRDDRHVVYTHHADRHRAIQVERGDRTAIRKNLSFSRRISGCDFGQFVDIGLSSGE